MLLPDLHIGFSRGRSGGLVFTSLSEFSTVYWDPHKCYISRWIKHRSTENIIRNVTSGFYQMHPLSQNLMSHKTFLSSVQLFSHVQLFATPWTSTRQASLSITNSRSPPKPMSIELVMPSNHLFLCRPLLHLPQYFPASGSLPMSQLFASNAKNIGSSVSTSVFPMNTQDWYPLGWTGWISLQSKGLSRVFPNTTVQKYQFFGSQLFYSPTLNPYLTTGKTIALTRQTFLAKVMSLLFIFFIFSINIFILIGG